MSLTHPAVRRTHDVDAHEELVEQLDQQVREVVRRDGVDPQRDAPLVRRIAAGVVRDHDERSLTGRVAAVPDVDAMVGELVARISGFGPLQPFLDDPSVEEVWINDPSGSLTCAVTGDCGLTCGFTPHRFPALLAD